MQGGYFNNNQEVPQKITFDVYVNSVNQNQRPASMQKNNIHNGPNRPNGTNLSINSIRQRSASNRSWNVQNAYSSPDPTNFQYFNQPQIAYQIMHQLSNPMNYTQNFQNYPQYPNFQEPQFYEVNQIQFPNTQQKKNIIRKRIQSKREIPQTQNSDTIGDEIKAEEMDRFTKKPLKNISDKSAEGQSLLLQMALEESMSKKNLEPINKFSFVGQKNENPKLKNCRKQLQQILEEDGAHSKYHQVVTNIQQATSIEEMVEIMLEYTKRKTAQKLASTFFFALGKDKIIVSKIDQFYDMLRKQKMPGQDINMIRNYVQNGKKWKIHEFLTEKLGSYQGKNIFNEYSSEFPEKYSQPLPNSVKIHKNQSGLQIYRYPESQISDFEKNMAKTLIVLGETGCGKSTFLNSLANYLAGVELEDPFRYLIVVENTSSQINSITRQISVYYIKDIRTNNCYRVIDTPGFGDTQGINRDYETVKKIEKLFKTSIDSLHLVLFLIKSSTTRMTAFHRYIFENVMDLFDTTIAQNFVFVLTFADASKSVAVDWIQNKDVGFGTYWDSLKQPKTIEVNNSGFFQKIVPQKDIEMISQFWKIGCSFMSKLVQKASMMSPKSLTITKTLINEKERLSLRIKDTAQKIQITLAEQENIRQQIMKIIENEDSMKKNQNFQIQVSQLQWYAESVSANVTRCNNCMNSNCHDSCIYGDGQQKKNCTAMDPNGHCTVCPGKCHYSVHTNDHILRKSRTVTQKMTNEDLKSKYYDAKKNISWYEQSLTKILQNYENISEQLKQNIKEMTSLQQRLSKISLSKNKPLTTQDYILFLIQNEKAQRKEGYTKRIESYNLTLEQLKIEERTAKGKTFQDAQEKKNQLVQNLYKDKRAKQSSILQNIFGIFFKKK